nr:prephenate dehydrogenase [Actinomycetes bacterium]
GSFRDGTRVASTAPDLVRAMCEANSAQLLRALEQAIGLLGDARDDLAHNRSVSELVEAGHAARIRYDDLSRPEIVSIVIGSAGWRDELAAAARAGGVIRSALPTLGSRG